MENIRVLLIEDNPGDARLIEDMLAEAAGMAFTVDWKQTLKSGIDSLSDNRYSIVLLDLGLPDSPQRSTTFTRVQSVAPVLPIIILTGLDDDTFAVSTVRRGAQDYLVKGKIDANTLVRTIRYAIARRAGRETAFSVEELAGSDGKEGRAAYVAFKGQVFDATGSRRWKEGLHSAKHRAGIDLTEAILPAPHGEEVMARLPIVGFLALKETAQHKLFRKIDSLKPHTSLVHLTVAYTVVAPFSFAAWILLGKSIFDQITLYLLLLGLVTLPVSIFTGLIGWAVSYENQVSRKFNYKFSLSVFLFIAILGLFLWRLTSPEIVLASPAAYLYLVLLIIQFVFAVLLDYFGKKIVYS
ncbi:MAG: response regulator [Dehalococcoidales bacterium]|nr:response regulator [Dehalococcoidales bacterium]